MANSPINTDVEQLLTAKQACEAFPTPVAMPTVWRWMLKGTRGVVLESIRIGGRRYTSVEACSRFIEASANDASPNTRNTTEAIRCDGQKLCSINSASNRRSPRLNAWSALNSNGSVCRLPQLRPKTEVATIGVGSKNEIVSGDWTS